MGGAVVRQWFGLMVTGGLLVGGCSPGSTASLEGELASTSVVSSTSAATVAPAEPVVIVLPTIPPVVMPETRAVGETGDLVASRLGDLISPVNGLELVSATCDDDSGELTYSGSTNGSNVFDISADGSGSYRDERGDGVVELEVAADGSGRFVDSSGGGLVTIEAAADGSGTYYNQSSNGLIAVEVLAAGGGTYYDDRDDREITAQIGADGSGVYTHKDEKRHVTINAQPDGVGELFWQRADDGSTTTVKVDVDGAWFFSSGSESRRLKLSVAADGSGSYTLSGLDTDGFDFGPDGRGLEPNEHRTIEVPERPVFSVASDVPELGRLGSLSPPCATVLRFDTSLLFGFGEATLAAEAAAILDEVADVLNKVGREVEIVGHTDSIGSDEANLVLSLDRANAVQAGLVERGLTIRTETIGKGEADPVAPNERDDGSDDPAGRSLNRRVEIVIPEPLAG